MLFRILKKDFQKNKLITIVLFMFIMISALLSASGLNIIVELSNSLNNLLIKSDAPHFVQMHSGEIDQSAIDDFALKSSLVKKQQTIDMLVIDYSNISFGDDSKIEKNSVMDNGFVKQSDSFDFLLDLENQPIKVSKGEIAVPIYYMQQNDIKIGDKIKISDEKFDMEFIVTDFVRDVQMNPSIISSKRFVVNKDDFMVLSRNIGEMEYMIEFQINDLGKLSEISNLYQSTNLPQKGPTIDYNLFKTVNALTDGIIAVVIILISILFIFIAILCLRFTILTTVEEDYKEIGVMKAIGIRQRDIKKIYMTKYITISTIACISGYFISLSLNKIFTSNIGVYTGIVNKNLLQNFIPMFAIVLIFVAILFSCILILRRFASITAVEALRSGTLGETSINTSSLMLNKSKFLNIDIFLGIKDIFSRFKIFALLFIIFSLCSFIIIVPVNFLSTIKSPSFISYMGVGKSDIRIDLQQSGDIFKRIKQVTKYIEKDCDIEKFSPLVTCKFKVLGDDEVWENINVETGDFSVFPLTYLSGDIPVKNNEIALSYLNSIELNKKVGDTITLLVNKKEVNMKVCGIYQDITNGGKTAKANLPINNETLLWYTISLNVKQNVNIIEKVNEYTNKFYSVKVTDIENYISQTLGNITEQLRTVTVFSVIIAIFASILITSLFLKMLIAKDSSQIAIMRSIGFSVSSIRIQYITRVLIVLGIGIIVGTTLANTVGESLVGLLMQSMGASNIQFIVNPIMSYLLYPLILIFTVIITTLINIISIKKFNVNKIIME